MLCKDTSTFSLKISEKAVKNQVARQDSRHGGPEESRATKHTYSHTGHVIRCATSKMPDAQLPKKDYNEELHDGFGS